MTNLIDDMKKYKTGLYIRLSKEDGDKEESDSITNQRKILYDFIGKSPEFILIDEYVDDGCSGTTSNRPAFKKLLADINTGIIDCVIVKDLSRFARDYILTGTLIEYEFRQKNIRFISILDNVDTIQKGKDSLEALILPLKNVFNDYYSRDISQKVKKSFQIKKQNGQYVGGFAPYGYKKDRIDKYHLVVDDYAADVVRDIFNMYIDGMSITKIAWTLNEKEILSPSAYKIQNGIKYYNGRQLLKEPVWTRSVISEMLRNEMYIGNLVQGKTSQGVRQKKKRTQKEDWIIVKNTHEAIIEKDVFEKVQFLLSRNVRRIKQDGEYAEAIFSGFIRCGDCGLAMSQRRQRKNNISYTCSNYTRNGSRACSSHYISQIQLTKIVLNDLNTITQKIINLENIIENQLHEISSSKKRPNYCEIENDIEKCKKRKLNAYKDFQDGLLTKNDYLNYIKEFEYELLELEKRKNFLEEREKTCTNFKENTWIKTLLTKRKFETLDRDIVYEMIDCITVFESGKIIIKYKFSDEFSDILEEHNN